MLALASVEAVIMCSHIGVPKESREREREEKGTSGVKTAKKKKKKKEKKKRLPGRGRRERLTGL